MGKNTLMLKKLSAGVPMADSCWCMRETTKFCKAIIIQFKK